MGFGAGDRNCANLLYFASDDDDDDDDMTMPMMMIGSRSSYV